MANKDFRPIIEALREQGWAIKMTADRHVRATPPDRNKPLVHFAMSNEPRAIKNAVAELRRSGFVWDTDDDQATAAAQGGEAKDEGIIDVDELYDALKHARDFRELAREEKREAEAAVKKATDRARSADEALVSAEETLQRAKTKFDAAFAATDGPTPN